MKWPELWSGCVLDTFLCGRSRSAALKQETGNGGENMWKDGWMDGCG